MENLFKLLLVECDFSDLRRNDDIDGDLTGTGRGALVKDSRRWEYRPILFYMPRDELGHLEHADLLLATKDNF